MFPPLLEGWRPTANLVFINPFPAIILHNIIPSAYFAAQYYNDFDHESIPQQFSRFSPLLNHQFVQKESSKILPFQLFLTSWFWPAESYSSKIQFWSLLHHDFGQALNVSKFLPLLHAFTGGFLLRGFHNGPTIACSSLLTILLQHSIAASLTLGFLLAGR